MANRFVEDMLRAKYGRMHDGRNPYGSRGGYVVSSRRVSRGRGRDRAMEDYGYDMTHERPVRGYEHEQEYRHEDDMRRRDMEDYDMNYYPYGSMGYHYPPMDYGYDYARRSRRDYGDHEEMEYGKMSKKDFEKWGKSLENEDGSRGEHFKKEQAEQLARQMGIDVHSLGGAEVFAMAMNMKYADYCGVARKYGVDRPEYYADLAKAFLHDKDYKGNPEEKLWLYYKCIASEE